MREKERNAQLKVPPKTEAPSNYRPETTLKTPTHGTKHALPRYLKKNKMPPYFH